MYAENEPAMKRNEAVLNDFPGQLCAIEANDKIWDIVKLGNRCTLKLEKATKASFMGFFSCYLSRKVPHCQDCIKTQVRMMKKSQRSDYHLKKLFVAHFFSIIGHYFFRLFKKLPNVRNNWKSHCAWTFQLLRTHTLYLCMKET